MLTLDQYSAYNLDLHLCYASIVKSYAAPSSSGLGHQVLILKIAGSNPAGVTKKIPEP